MKNISKRIFGVVFVLLSVTAGAQERASVTLSLPAYFAAKICPSPVWKGTTILWKGVTDVRTEKEIGRQSKKKGKNPVFVDAQPPIEHVFDEALKTLMPACGLRFVTDGKADMVMSAEVGDFYAGVEKGLFVGKGVAKSQILFRIKKANDTTDRTVEVGYEIESKKIRQKDIRQLEKTLNELLLRTLEQVPKLDGFKGF